MKYYLYNDNIGSIELVDYMGSDITVVNSARVSYGVHKKELDNKDKKLISYLIKHKHTSTLEHNIATFRIKVPLFIRSQHHRHRTWSYNEISRRYTEFNMEFYEPESFRTQHKINRQASNNELINPNIISKEITTLMSADVPVFTLSEAVKYHHNQSINLYNRMLDLGVSKEQARGVLPQNLYTEYYATANLNNILKFVGLRSHEGAQWEIQKLSDYMLELIRGIWPVVVDSYIKNV
jgi:thymidylate synthase (FAD)